MKSILSLAMVVALASACSQKSPDPAPKAKSGITAQSASGSTNIAAWNWDAYPAVKKMRLGLLPCTLQPRSQITINSTLSGALKLYVDQPQTNLAAGTVWGEFEPTIFELEAQSIEETRVKIEEREKLQAELEIPRLRLKLEREAEEMQRQVAYIRYLSTNMELANLTMSVGGNNSIMRPDSLAKAEQELSFVTQTLQYLDQTNSAVLPSDFTTLRSSWRQRKVEFERRRAQATLKMPFNGQLTVSLPLADGLAEYPVNVGQELGIARDLSTVRLRVSIGNTAWNSLSPDRLFVVVRLPSGQELEAQFAYHKVERAQSREESAYYFQFLPEHTATVARLIGTDVTCELWLNLGQATRIVPKLALIMHNPVAFQSGNWGAGIAAAFPGSRLAVEGQTDLGIILPGNVVAAAR